MKVNYEREYHLMTQRVAELLCRFRDSKGDQAMNAYDLLREWDTIRAVKEAE